MGQNTQLAEEIRKHQDAILKDWMAYQVSALTLRRDLVKESELRESSRQFLELFSEAFAVSTDSSSPRWKPAKDNLAEISQRRAMQGFSPSETATFVFSLKQPLFSLAQQRFGQDGKRLAEMLWDLTMLLDKLGLYTTEVYQESREGVIHRQQQELMELSTPVVQLWDEVLALPLIGTLDSARTQVVMENLLQRVVETGARDRDHRHHRSADGRHAGGTTSHEDRRGDASHGGGLHYQRHSSANRPDDRSSGRQPERHHYQGHAGGRVPGRPHAAGCDGLEGGPDGIVSIGHTAHADGETDGTHSHTQDGPLSAGDDPGRYA